MAVRKDELPKGINKTQIMSLETTKQKIEKSLVPKTKIAKLLNIPRGKFYVKLQYNDFTPQEIKILKESGAIK